MADPKKEVFGGFLFELGKSSFKKVVEDNTEVASDFLKKQILKATQEISRHKFETIVAHLGNYERVKNLEGFSESEVKRAQRNIRGLQKKAKQNLLAYTEDTIVRALGGYIQSEGEEGCAVRLYELGTGTADEMMATLDSLIDEGAKQKIRRTTAKVKEKISDAKTKGVEKGKKLFDDAKKKVAENATKLENETDDLDISPALRRRLERSRQ